MRINIDTYSYVANVNQTAAKRGNRVKEDAETKASATAQSQSAVPSKSQIEPQDTALPQVNHELVKNAAEDETTFPALNIFSKYEKYFKALNEHYSKVNEENKKFSDPQKHINDKYYNKNSSYYVTGLTQREREICAKAEQDVLNGIPPALNGYDPVIQEKFHGCNIFTMDMEWNQDVRENMNDAVNQAFQENGIMIPEDANLKLTVDPYDFYIHATGVDEELAKKIDDVLNKGKNGYYMYYHISNCNPSNYGVAEPSQYTSGDGGKMAVYHLVDQLTGYDIRELEHRDGKFYTPDGEDLWEVLTDKYNELAADGGASSFGLGEYYAEYKRIAKEGWNRSTDSNLTIGYKNGSLYDLDTSYGYGPKQKAWQDNVKNWYEGNYDIYQKQRQETLRSEKNTPAKPEMAIAAAAQMTAELGWDKKIISDGKNGAFQLIAPDISKLQEILNRLQKDGLLTPLTDRVLSLRGEVKASQGFDHKA